MKDKVKIVVISIMLTTVLSNIYAKPKKTVKIANPVRVEVDTLAFDEDSLLGIYDGAGNLISNFSRIEKKNNYISPFRVLGNNKEHLYTVSYDDINNIIIIVSKEKKKGKIAFEIKKKGLLGIWIKVKTRVSFFGKPYKLKYTKNNSFKNHSTEYTITYDSKPVIKKIWKYDAKKGKSFQKIVVDKLFLDDNKIDCSIWILALQALDEASLEYKRYNRY